MLKYLEGTVFNIDAHALVNTVNCIGIMGAGIALEFKLRYPLMFEDYEAKCNQKQITTGNVYYYKNDDGKTIINFPTKWHFKYPSQLIWIEQGLQDFVKTYKQHGITSVAFPKLGTSNGGLHWEDVKRVMEKYLSNLDIDVNICLDSVKEAEGIEKQMLDKFNLMSIIQLADKVKLSSKQKEEIRSTMPYTRFWKIRETESIGIKTYSSMFKYFYNLASKIDEQKQLSIFEGID